MCEKYRWLSCLVVLQLALALALQLSSLVPQANTCEQIEQLNIDVGADALARVHKPVYTRY